MTCVAINSPHLPSALPGLALQSAHDGIAVLAERAGDAPMRERLLDRAFGPARFAKTCELFRAGRRPAEGLSLVALRTPGAMPSGLGVRQTLVGTVRLWHVAAGETAALLLGPLAVDGRMQAQGIGARLMEEAIARATALGHGAILLVGDAPYYRRFGFTANLTRNLDLPGPYEPARLLGLELVAGALAGANGTVRPTGAIDLRRQGGGSLRGSAAISSAVKCMSREPVGKQAVAQLCR